MIEAKNRALANEIFNFVDRNVFNRVYLIIKGNQAYSMCWNNTTKSYIAFLIFKIKFIKYNPEVIKPEHFFIQKTNTLYIYYYSVCEIKNIMRKIFHEQIKTLSQAKELFKYNKKLKDMLESL